MERIKKYLEKFRGKKTAVAYSGGVDSSLVAFYAREFADAILVRTEFTPRYLQEKARDFAKRFGVNYRLVDVKLPDELLNNPEDRCYLCKKTIFQKIKFLGYEVILDGTNADDLKEERPGLEANREIGTHSPLADLGLGKERVRELMSGIDRNVSLQPQDTCLATRVPFDSRITPDRLRRIDLAEDFLRSLGVERVRVRDHFPLARIQVQRKDFGTIIESMDLIQGFKSIGYEFITLDTEALE
jgi:uncharacterized protein